MPLYRIDAFGLSSVDCDFHCDTPERAAEFFITQLWNDQPLQCADYKLTIHKLTKNIDDFYNNGWENDRNFGLDHFDECGDYIATLKQLVSVKKV
jgi:hypothetical protein